MSVVAKKEISLSKDYSDSLADSYVVSDFSVSGQDYARISFMRHLHIPKELPQGNSTEVKMEFYAEALQSVSLPFHVAVEMATLILSSAQAKSSISE